MSLFMDTPGGRQRAMSAGQPRRRSDRDTTPGRCGNLDYCSIGMQRVAVQVPLSQPFVCPECGQRLRAPGRSGGGRRPWILPALRLGVLAIGMSATLATGYLLGRVQPAVHEAVHEAGASLHEAGIALGLDAPQPKPPIQAQAAAATPAAPLAPGTAPPAIFVAERPYPARDLPIETSHPPSHLAHEARFGQVVLDCAMEPVLTHPACKLTDIRGADAVSAAALAWLQSLAVQYAPSERTGTPVLLAHRWRVVFEDFAGLPRLKK